MLPRQARRRPSGDAAAPLYQIALGWLGYQLAADGRFGPITALTTKRFQADHGLLVDGRVGPQTRAAIAQAL